MFLVVMSQSGLQFCHSFSWNITQTAALLLTDRRAVKGR